MKLIYNSIKYNTTGLDDIFRLVAPHVCIACGKVGEVLCNDCLELAGNQPPPRCASCRQLTEDYATCSDCRKWLKLKHVYVVTIYDQWHKKLVGSLKFDLQRSTARVMALVTKRSYSVPEGFVLCPIPTASKRVRERGFDHAKLYARHFAKLHSPYPPIQNLLARKSNVRQLGSTRAERLKQMNNEFYVPNLQAVKDARVLLIDDVYTTGATLAAAAQTLREAGAKEISAVVFAQKEG